MSSIHLIATVAGIHLLAAIMPGPDFIMAVRNSLVYSRRTGIFTAIGFGLGIGVHILYSIAGIALIISQSILAFNAIKLFGAGYLIYAGFRSLFSKSTHLDVGLESKKADITPLAAIRIGFLTNVLNPKVTLFFLSLFTLVISPDTPASILAVASAIMILQTMLWFSLVALFFTQEKIRNIFERFQGLFHKTLGGILIALGVKVAMTNR